MTSFQQNQDFYHEQILKNIVNLSKYKNNDSENSDVNIGKRNNFWDVDENEIEDVPNNLCLSAYERIKQKIS